MARHELHRYVYMCDGLEQANKKCSGAEVIDAASEWDADKIARQRGWSNDRFGRWLCGQVKKHVKSVHTQEDQDDDGTEERQMQHLVHVGEGCDGSGPCREKEHYQWA